MIQAAAATIGFSESINVCRAKDRGPELFECGQLPGDGKPALAAALNGDPLHLLRVAMMDRGPKLRKNIDEVARCGDSR